MHDPTFLGAPPIFQIQPTGEFAHNIETSAANRTYQVLKMDVDLLTGTCQQAAHGPSHIPVHEFRQQEEGQGIEPGHLGSHVVDDGGRSSSDR